jgi:hypothetical protein
MTGIGHAGSPAELPLMFPRFGTNSVSGTAKPEMVCLEA